jgi:hypothetical protein
MSWTISHGEPGGRFDGYHSRSYGQIGEWRDAIGRVPLSARDAVVLRAVHRQVPRAQRELNQTLADAVELAAAANQPWRWS